MNNKAVAQIHNVLLYFLRLDFIVSGKFQYSKRSEKWVEGNEFYSKWKS